MGFLGIRGQCALRVLLGRHEQSGPMSWPQRGSVPCTAGVSASGGACPAAFAILASDILAPVTRTISAWSAGAIRAKNTIWRPMMPISALPEPEHYAVDQMPGRVSVARDAVAVALDQPARASGKRV